MRRFVYIWMALIAAATVAAQLPHSYTCDFEDTAENDLWVLNRSANAALTWDNKWAIGSSVASLGERAMYISPDGGATAEYRKTTSSIMIAYRELTLEAGRYDVAFDWMCGGDSARASLMVAWVPESDFYNSKNQDQVVCWTSDDYKNVKWINNNKLSFYDNELLTGGSVWTHAVDTLRSDGTPHRLVFLFIYSGAAQMVQPGPCVDNIQLCRNNCGEPTGMKVNTANQIATLSWESTGESFNFRMHRMGDNFATRYNGIKQNTFSVQLQEGVYDIQMQVVCEGDTSVWYSFPMAFIHEAKCFDYLDLTDERCSYSAETAGDYHYNDTLLKPGKIDYGFTSMWSRHTIHYHPEEYDARTRGSVDSEGNKVLPLKTVPDGALASVRIGSWEKYARVARMEYDFAVDAAEASVLMLQYAMVLESSGHEEEARPRLTIDIVNAATGKALSSCTTVDLAAQTSGEGWYRVPDPAYPDGSRDICWRDWTTLGLNLADYDGMHVKVKITVYGCTAEIHYGYAYFTLTCTSGQLRGIQCGWTPTNEFIAPDGFNYRWYLVDKPYETLGRSQTFPVDYRDTRDYAVDVTYKSNSDCGFTLYANAIPRFPVPEAVYSLKQHDCGNYISFTNTSHIRTRNWQTGEEIDTPYAPEYLLWDFDGFIPEGLDTPEKRWSPSFRLPNEEEDYHFRLYAGVGLCDSVQDFYIHVPHVGPDSVVETVQRCIGDIYMHKGRPFMADTTIIDHDINRIGCDSTHVTVLRFVDAIRDTLDVVITEGDSYLFDGRSLTMSGQYEAVFTSAMGCDSIVYLTLRVVVPLKMEITDVEQPCPEDASLAITVSAQKGQPCFYRLSFDAAGQAAGWSAQQDSLFGSGPYIIEIPLSASVRPGYYPFSIWFDSKENGTDSVSGETMVHYSASLIQQRWDDVLGILNADYNGGYEFTAFRWVRNGYDIDGADRAYYYTPDKLHAGDEYAVWLYTEGDERPVSTCAYTVPAAAAPVPQPGRQKLLRDGRLVIIVDGHTYNAQGQIISHE